MTDRDFIREYIAELAEGASEAAPCHWIHGANEIDDLDCTEADDFCRPCAEKKLAAFAEAHPDRAEAIAFNEYGVDGGWRTDHDSAPFCATCGVKLIGSLTDYGAHSELEHFEENYPRDCEEWEALGNAIENLGEDDDGWNIVEEIVTTTVRLSLIDVLTARELDLQVPECEECGDADATRCPAEACGRPLCAGCNPLHYDGAGDLCELARARMKVTGEREAMAPAFWIGWVLPLLFLVSKKKS